MKMWDLKSCIPNCSEELAFTVFQIKCKNILDKYEVANTEFFLKCIELHFSKSTFSPEMKMLCRLLKIPVKHKENQSFPLMKV